MSQVIGFQIQKIKGEMVLRPFSDEDIEMIKHYQVNQRITAEIMDGKKLGVSIPQFGLYFACCKKVAENTEDRNWNTKEKVDYQIRLGVGYVEFTVVLPDGTTTAKPKTLTHKNINHFIMNNYMSNALDLMSLKLGCTIEQLIDMAKSDMRSY